MLAHRVSRVCVVDRNGFTIITAEESASLARNEATIHEHVAFFRDDRNFLPILEHGGGANPLEWALFMFELFDLMDNGKRPAVLKRPALLDNILFTVGWMDQAARNGEPGEVLRAAKLTIKVLACHIVEFQTALQCGGMRPILHSLAITNNGAPKAQRIHSEKAQQRYATIRAEVQALLANGCDTLTNARNLVAEQLGEDGSPLQSLATVKRATAGMKGRPRKTKK
jgi:hypothetical protein